MVQTEKKKLKLRSLLDVMPAVLSKKGFDGPENPGKTKRRRKF